MSPQVPQFSSKLSGRTTVVILVILTVILFSFVRFPSEKIKPVHLIILNPTPVLAYPTYNREDWHNGWRDPDGNCLDLRHELLKQHNRGKLVLSKDRCRVEGGEWRDPYTGKVYDDPRELEIDHLVSLKEAHISGGYAWSTELRRAFAEDTSNLVVTARTVNREKGSSDPVHWRPRINSCEYLQAWLTIKEKWELNLDSAEQALFAEVREAKNCEIPLIQKVYPQLEETESEN